MDEVQRSICRCNGRLGRGVSEGIRARMYGGTCWKMQWAGETKSIKYFLTLIGGSRERREEKRIEDRGATVSVVGCYSGSNLVFS